MDWCRRYQLVYANQLPHTALRIALGVELCTDYTLNGLVFESVFQSGTWQKKSRHTSSLRHAKI